MTLSEELGLAQRFTAGDDTAFSQIYEESYPYIRGFILRKTGSIDIAEELTAETLAHMWEHRARFKFQGYTIIHWALVIARNLVNSFYRKEYKRRKSDLVELEEMAITDIELEMLENEDELTHFKVSDVLCLLSPLQGYIIYLRFELGYSIIDVAAIVNRSTANVKALQHKGIVKLREELIKKRLYS